MEKIYVKARAKINLNLEVLEKRPDNYHNIKSVFQKINLYDEMYINKTDTNIIEINTNVEELNNSENIICKAYDMLKAEFNQISGLKVLLKKNIPMQAGLGGGSTDCAAFLLCVNKLFNLKLSKNKIEEIAKKLGADVVPCLYNKAVLAEGIGEIITPIDTNFKYHMLIIKPETHCSTKEMYKKLDEEAGTKERNDTSELIIKALKEKDVKLLAKNLYNMFETATKESTIIQKLKDILIENGAIGSLMTGSGSCVFGIFKNRETAKRAYMKLKDKYKTYICTSYNSKKEV